MMHTTNQSLWGTLLGTGFCVALVLTLASVAGAEEGSGSAAKSADVDYLQSVKDKAAQIASV
jgi:hypothetical protein